MKAKKQGCIHIYCGNGKGKTTAGMGLCLRAAGHGERVLIYQFLKDNTTGEAKSLALLPTVKRLSGKEEAKFSFQMTEAEKQAFQTDAHALLEALLQTIPSYDLLFLDEAIYAVDAGLLDEEKLLTFLEKRPPQLEVILTGQNPSKRLLDAADYVSEIQKVKHPFDKGQPSRQGVEW
jgi:cob(I)alamin adenosyltransferase